MKNSHRTAAIGRWGSAIPLILFGVIVIAVTASNAGSARQPLPANGRRQFAPIVFGECVWGYHRCASLVWLRFAAQSLASLRRLPGKKSAKQPHAKEVFAVSLRPHLR